MNDCGGCNRNKREGNRERAECCSNSVAQSAPSACFPSLTRAGPAAALVLCASELSLADPQVGAAGASSCPHRGGRAQAALGAGRGTAGARLVEMVGSRILFAAPFSEHFTKAGAAPGDFDPSGADCVLWFA